MPLEAHHHHHHHCNCHHQAISGLERIHITDFRLDYHPLDDDLRTHFSATQHPVFSWSVATSCPDDCQTACQLVIASEDGMLWDSGLLKTRSQELPYAGDTLPAGAQLTVTLTVYNRLGCQSLPFVSFFYVSAVTWEAGWITIPPELDGNHAIYFKRDFSISETPLSARLYVSSLGYQRILLNGEPLDEGPVSEAPLDPPVVNAASQNQYVLYPEIQDMLEDDNTLTIIVGKGYRENQPPMLTAMLVMEDEDGTVSRLMTDTQWTCNLGPIRGNHPILGTVFDARQEPDPTDTGLPAALADLQAPAGPLVPMQLPPLAGADDTLPVAQWPSGQSCLLDFGETINGVIRLAIPAQLPHDTAITIRYAEELTEDGNLPITQDLPTDTYIATGHEEGDDFFQPHFTIHRFRYALVDGLGTYLPPQDVAAVTLRLNLDTETTFHCDNPRLNQLHGNSIKSQRAMLTGTLPASVTPFALCALPYCSEAHHLITKFVQDIADAQLPDGSLKPTSTLQNAKPDMIFCDALIQAVWQSYLFYGDRNLLRLAHKPLADWTHVLQNGTPQSLVSALHACHSWHVLADMAQVLQQPQTYFERQAKQSSQNLSNLWTSSSATVQECALALDLETSSEDLKRQAIQNVKESLPTISPKDIPFAVHALTAAGLPDEACELLLDLHTNSDAPELHSWFHSHLAGIRPLEPGWNKFIIQPAFPRQLSELRTNVQTPRGIISLHWFKKNSSLNMHVTIPFGTIAMVCFNGEHTECHSGFHVFQQQL